MDVEQMRIVIIHSRRTHFMNTILLTSIQYKHRCRTCSMHTQFGK